MQNISIQVEDLQKSYKKLNVLKGVDFTVEQGSIFALLGSNGAGKTTTDQNPHHAAQTGRRNGHRQRL